MHQGVVLHDGTDQIRRSYYPARSVILRDDPHRLATTTPQQHHPSSSSGVSSVSSPIPSTTCNAAVPHDDAAVIGLGTPRIVDRNSRSYMAPTASSQRKILGAPGTEEVSDSTMTATSRRHTGRWPSPTPGGQHRQAHSDSHEALAAVAAQRRYSTKVRRAPAAVHQRTADSESAPDLAALLLWWTSHEDEARACIEAEEDFAWVTVMERVMDVLAHTVLLVGATQGPSSTVVIPAAAEGKLTSPASFLDSTECGGSALPMYDGVERGDADAENSTQYSSTQPPEVLAAASGEGHGSSRWVRTRKDFIADDSLTMVDCGRTVDDVAATLTLPPLLSEQGPPVGEAATLPAVSEEIQQYLRAVHFRTVALSAEVLKMTQSQQSLQTSLRDAQAEIERLRFFASTSHRSAASPPRESDREVPVHPALQQHVAGAPLRPSPDVSSSHLRGGSGASATISGGDDFGTEREVLGVQGPGNIAKSVFLLLSYPMQCCLRFNVKSSSAAPASSPALYPVPQQRSEEVQPSFAAAAAVADPPAVVPESGASLPVPTPHGDVKGDENTCPDDSGTQNATSSIEPPAAVTASSASIGEK